LALWSKDYRFNPASGDYEHYNLDVEFPSLACFHALPIISPETNDNETGVNKVNPAAMLRKLFG